MKSNLPRIAITAWVILSLGQSCARAPLRGAYQAMRMIPAPTLSDDLPRDELLKAIEAQIHFLESDSVSPGSSGRSYQFGPESYSEKEYLAGLKHFVELGREVREDGKFFEAVKRDFNFYEVYGQKSWGETFITSYYEPVIQGSLKKTKSLTQPLYRRPPDLIDLDLSLFDQKFSSERKYRGRLENNAFVPYYTREDIDSKNVLQGKKLELCWVDPLDAFFLQVEGSGTVDLGHGKELKLNYAEKNGRPYEALGKFVKPYLGTQDVNFHTITSYMRSLPARRMQELLNMNPSYVFFQPSEKNALTFLGVSATAGRTIATDRQYFPKGALGFLVFDKPVFLDSSSLQPVGTSSTERFVLDQDIGGAITGGGRVDLFWGRGPDAERYAGVIKSTGRLIYIAPKRAG